jgi:transmembrane sensor
MSFQDLNDGFEKYLNQKFTAEEQAAFFKWLAQKDNEEKVKQYLYNQLDHFSSSMEVKDVDFDNIYAKVIDDISIDEKKPTIQFNKRIRQAGVAIAGIAAIALIVWLSVMFTRKSILNNGQKSFETAYYEVKSPLGAKTELTLPDGSQVWLNAGSKLKYNAAFGIKNRAIQLEGEAFFKVAKNKAIPFIVKTTDIDIKAVGTSFNVKAYQDEGTIETTLVEGEVVINRTGKESNTFGNLYLEPNQKATFIKEKTSINVTDVKRFKEELPPKIKIETGKVYIIPKIDTEPAIAWKDNLMIIRGEEMASLIIKLERKYNVEIQIQSDYLRNFRFSGTLGDETLQQVLNVIKLSAPIDYSIDGKLVTIKENALLRDKFKRYLKNND